ncbi:MAG: hypothetical protein JWQ20_4100 [Conexibacter sp.]|nr:hypothetical protein [Solirubrobacterales bacterium]MCW3004802.1 hypothetical protein [Conexibacter sp.]
MIAALRQSPLRRHEALACLGALLTIPDNVQQSPAIASAAAALENRAEPLSAVGVTRSGLAALLAAHPATRVELFPNAFTSVIVSQWGSATALCGPVEDAVVDAEQALEAIGLLEDELVVAAVATLARAVVALLSVLAERLALTPNEGVEPRLSGGAVIPETKWLLDRGAKLTFSAAELAEAIGTAWADDLRPLFLEDVGDQADPLVGRPLVATPSGGLVVARPDLIAVALRHAALRTVIDCGAADKRGRRVGRARARRSCRGSRAGRP